MKVVLILLAMTVPASALSQDGDPSKKGMIEEAMKGRGTAFILTTLLPGAGQFYAGEEEFGVVTFLLTAASAIWMVRANASEDGTAGTGPRMLFLMMRFGDYVAAIRGVDQYNENLGKRLGMRLGTMQDGSTAIKLSLTF